MLYRIFSELEITWKSANKFIDEEHETACEQNNKNIIYYLFWFFSNYIYVFLSLHVHVYNIHILFKNLKFNAFTK